MNKQISAVLIIVVAALVIWAVWSTKHQSQTQNNQGSTAVSPNPTPSPSPSASTSGSQPQLTSKISDADFKALITTSQDPKLDLKQFAQTVTNDGIAASTLDVTDCKPVPNILQVRAGGKVTLKNGNNVPHTLSYGAKPGEKTLGEVGAQTTAQLTSFPAPGIYGYYCDNNGPAGFLQVISQ